MKFLRRLVKERKLSPAERISGRIAYMGSAFIMLSPYLIKHGDIGAVTYIIGGILLVPQVWMAKQWNLVIININLILGYLLYFISG